MIYKLDQKGMSLVGTLVASGMIATISLALGTIVHRTLATTALVEHKIARSDISIQVNAAMANATSECTANFGGQVVPSTTNQPVRINALYFHTMSGNPIEPAIAEVGKEYTPGLTVKDIQLVNHVDLGASQKLSELELTFSSSKGTIRNIKIPNIKVNVDASNSIVACGNNSTPPEPQYDIVSTFRVGGFALNGGEQIIEHNNIKRLIEGVNLYVGSHVESDYRNSVAHFTTTDDGGFQYRGVNFGPKLTIVHQRDWVGIAAGHCGNLSAMGSSTDDSDEGFLPSVLGGSGRSSANVEGGCVYHAQWGRAYQDVSITRMISSTGGTP